MAEAVYVLCTATSIACAVFLLRGYRESKTKLLFWSSLCFAGLAINNVLLFVDLVLLPDVDVGLVTWRNAIALASMMVLLHGLVWEAQ